MGYNGEPVAYGASTLTSEEAWQRLSEGIRWWVGQRAGEPITDPHTGAPTVYFHCQVDPEPQGGPPGVAMPARYRLVLFGRRALVVSSGRTDVLREPPEVTSWRHRRFDIAVDGERVRHDHRRAAVPHTPASGTASGVTRGTSQVSVDVLPGDVAATFGNLPLPTQQFLLEPFVASGTRPSESAVEALCTRAGHEFSETYWTYLFNRRWAGFAYSRRVAVIPGTADDSVWAAGSPALAELQRQPWQVAAWTAPVL